MNGNVFLNGIVYDVYFVYDTHPMKRNTFPFRNTFPKKNNHDDEGHVPIVKIIISLLLMEYIFSNIISNDYHISFPHYTRFSTLTFI